MHGMHRIVTFNLVSGVISQFVFLSGHFSWEEGGRTREWDPAEQWPQVQTEAGEHSASAQVEDFVSPLY